VLPLEKKETWVVAATFLTPPHNFDQSDHTGPSLRHHGSIFMDRFGYDAAYSSEMSRRHRWSRATAWDRVCVEFYLQKAENSRVNDTADLGREEYHGD
jgi:hypothetical protein